MRTFLILVICACAWGIAGEGQLAPRVQKLSEQEVGQWVGKVHPKARVDNSIMRRGLVSGQTALRADCARYLASHGGLSDMPYLIDALSDESQHDGDNYPYAGMATTRYWANVALICIAKADLGYRWDDPVKQRQAAIRRWTNHWGGVKHQASE